MKKYIVGLDIGVASVGWAVLDEKNDNIINLGVRLFPQGGKEENKKRRTKRGARRLIRRKNYRVQILKKLFKKEGLIKDDFKELSNPYAIRCKGLKEKLSNEELLTAILYIAKHRGVTGDWTITDDEKKTKDDETTKKALLSNSKDLQDKYVCQIQLERFEKNGHIKGIDNCFTTEDYIKELRKIFTNQNLNKDLENLIIDIISRRRNYEFGPGSENSITQYGSYYIDENGEVKKISLIEKMRGKCTMYKEELRAPRQSYSAGLFVLLDELNNIKILEEYLDQVTKENLINKYFSKSGNLTITQFLKEVGLVKEEITKIKGIKVDDKGNLIFTPLKGFVELKKIVKKYKLDTKVLEDKKLYDKISEILTNQKSVLERKNLLKELGLNSLEVEHISMCPKFVGYHRYSFKALEVFNKEMWETNNNHVQIIFNNKHIFEKKNYKGLKNIPFDDGGVLSPTAKRSQREAIKVINEIKKKYKNIDSVVVELARETNSLEDIQRIKKLQAQNADLREKIDKKIKEYNKDNKDNKIYKTVEDLKKGKNKTIEKLILYLDQECKCMYSGKSLDLNKIIYDPNYVEIDHIIPLSISLDDSRSNKVLVLSEENQKKGQQTPKQYFDSGRAEITYEEFKKHVLSLNLEGKYGYKNRNNLLFEEDINLYDVKKQFINRNLVDTRISSRNILNILQNYFKDNEIETKVYCINGLLTSMIRRNIGFKKERDLNSNHHAHDAALMAAVTKAPYIKKLLKISKTESQYDQETGEVKNNNELYNETDGEKFVAQLLEKEIKFSHKIDKKNNRSLSDDTIYGTRIFNNEEMVIGKYKDIYSVEGDKVKKMLSDDKKAQKLLIYKDKDNKNSIYRILMDAIKMFPEEKNPFAKYKEVTGEYLRKYSKKGNGPIIKSLKYIDGRVGETVIDISHKYQTGDRRVILKQLNQYRLDVYKSNDGTYKLLLVAYVDIKNKDNKSWIAKEHYEFLKEKYNINNEDKFQFSLYYNSIIKIEDKFYRYAGVMNYRYGLIYYKTIDNSKVYKVKLNKETNEEELVEEKRLYISVKNAKVFEKYNVSILGDYYKAKEETCELDVTML